MAAGLGFKTFTTGEVLTAADTNGYLMQGVLVFASAAARDAAITSPQEGQCCYLKDTDAVLTYSGAAWVGFDDSNAIQNTIVDAKGDIVAASGSDTPARLAVGNNGETLVADSSQTTGLRYNPSQAAGKNVIINGDFDIWQRGTSSTTNGNYNSADRWWNYVNAGTNTWSRESTIVPTGSLYSMKSTQSVATATNWQMNQAIETLNAIQYAGKTVNLSAQFCASASTTVSINLSYSTSTDVAPAGSWTGITSSGGTSSATSATTASFTQLSAQYAIPSTAKSLLVIVSSTSVASGTSVYVGKVQLELGSVATAFTKAGGTIQGELAACQRYYVRYDAGTSNYVPLTPLGFSTSTTSVSLTFQYPVVLRGQASAVDYANLSVYGGSGGAFISVSSLTLTRSSTMMAELAATVSGATNNNVYRLQPNNAVGYIGFTAEL